MGSSFIAFLVYSALHIPLIIAEKNMNELKAPVIQIVTGTDISHPILRFKSNHPEATYEIRYLIPKANVVFLTKETQTDLEKVPGVAPCGVQARVKVGQIVSPWSKRMEIPLIEIDSVHGLVVRDGY